MFFREFFMFTALFCLSWRCFEPFGRLTAVLFALLLTITANCAETVGINICATADLHGNETQFAKAVAPHIENLRRKDRSLIYVDAGDTVQGTLSLMQRRGRGFMRKLAAAGCSVWVPGNHDLEYGLAAFREIVREFPGSVLSCNMRVKGLEDKLRDVVIVERKGVKIAFIGMMLGSMEMCFPMPPGAWQTVKEAAALRCAADKAIKARADIAVLVRHAGIYSGGEKLSALLHLVPEIDLVIGAHTHSPEAGVKVQKSWYIQPGAYGKSVAECCIVWDKQRRQIVQIRSRLQHLKVFPENEPPEAALPAPPLTGENINCIAEKIRKHYAGDLAFYIVSNLPEYKKLLKNPAPVIGDYYRVFNYIDPAVTVEVTADEAEKIILENLALARGRKQRLLTAGFRIKNKKVVFDRELERYKLVLTAYSAAGGSGKLMLTRRTLSGRICFDKAENTPGVLEIITGADHNAGKVR